jgi:hypothetical protein
MVDEVEVERCLLFLLLNIGSVKSTAESNVDTILAKQFLNLQHSEKLQNKIKENTSPQMTQQRFFCSRIRVSGKQKVGIQIVLSQKKWLRMVLACRKHKAN